MIQNEKENTHMRYLLYLPNPETITCDEWIDCGMYLWRLEMGRKQTGFEYKENDTDFLPELSVA